jgi:hypothetical protein
VLLIFVFIGREALPVIFGREGQRPPAKSNSRGRPGQTQAATGAGYTRVDTEAIRFHGSRHLEDLDGTEGRDEPEIPGRSRCVDQYAELALFGYMPYKWNGYERRIYLAADVNTPKYNIVPLIIGSLKTTIVALLVAVPMALAAAIYVPARAAARSRDCQTRDRIARRHSLRRARILRAHRHGHRSAKSFWV